MSAAQLVWRPNVTHLATPTVTVKHGYRVDVIVRCVTFSCSTPRAAYSFVSLTTAIITTVQRTTSTIRRNEYGATFGARLVSPDYAPQLILAISLMSNAARFAPQPAALGCNPRSAITA